MMRPRGRRPKAGPAEPLVQLNARLPRSLRLRLRLVCFEQGREMQDYIAEALREYLRARLRP